MDEIPECRKTVGHKKEGGKAAPCRLGESVPQEGFFIFDSDGQERWATLSGSLQMEIIEFAGILTADLYSCIFNRRLAANL